MTPAPHAMWEIFPRARSSSKDQKTLSGLKECLWALMNLKVPVTGLRDLSQAFAAIGFKDGVRTELRNRRREGEHFHIPERSEGAELIQSKFLSFYFAP